MKWQVVIYGPNGSRTFVLDHDYDTVQEAEKEAENIADQEYNEADDGWILTRLGSEF